MLKITKEKYFGSRQLRPENLKPLKKGLSAQLKCLMVKGDADGSASEEVIPAMGLFRPSDTSVRSSSWLKPR